MEKTSRKRRVGEKYVEKLKRRKQEDNKNKSNG